MKLSCNSSAQDSFNENVTQIAELFQLLGSPTRLRIIAFLSKTSGCSVNEIAGELGISQSALSHQLRILQSARLVERKRAGKNAYYTIKDKNVVFIITQTMNMLTNDGGSK